VKESTAALRRGANIIGKSVAPFLEEHGKSDLRLLRQEIGEALTVVVILRKACATLATPE